VVGSLLPPLTLSIPRLLPNPVYSSPVQLPGGLYRLVIINPGIARVDCCRGVSIRNERVSLSSVTNLQLYHAPAVMKAAGPIIGEPQGDAESRQGWGAAIILGKLNIAGQT